MRTRVEVNENGEFYTIIPDEVVADFGFDEGEQIEWDLNDEEFIIINVV